MVSSEKRKSRFRTATAMMIRATSICAVSSRRMEPL
jgi:hypothetical protein